MTFPPIPEPDVASAEFFSALDGGRLELRRCMQCGTVHLAALVCDACGGTEFAPIVASGAGTVHSFTRLHMVHHAAFAEQLPLTAGVVELAEGPRLFAQLVGPGACAVGTAVSAEFKDCDGRGLVVFRLTPS